jgi:hypothetical protein
MLYDIFDPKGGHSYPHNPGVYIGSIEIDTTIDKDGISTELRLFDLHLRETKRKAYGEGYELVKTRFNYPWRPKK